MAQQNPNRTEIPNATRRERVVDLADTVRDMGQRVVNNGGEPNYAGEKLGKAAYEAITALALMGWHESDITEFVSRAMLQGQHLRGRLR